MEKNSVHYLRRINEGIKVIKPNLFTICEVIKRAIKTKFKFVEKVDIVPTFQFAESHILLEVSIFYAMHNKTEHDLKKRYESFEKWASFYFKDFKNYQIRYKIYDKDYPYDTI